MKNRGLIVLALMTSLLLVMGCASAPPAPTAADAPRPATQAPPQAAPEAPQAAQVAPQPVAPAQPVETVKPSTVRPSSSLVSAEALGIYRSPDEMQQPPTKDEIAVIASAKTLLGKPPDAKVTVNGRGFTLDCIGTVSAIYYGVSLDVTKDFDIYTGNGVNRLYMTLQERNALHADKYPRPGDVIFWDNTWDAKGNGDRIHSPRTHAGIVLAVDEDGTIHYVHENLYKGIVIETMNLLRPTVARDEQGKLINSGMAIASKPGGPPPAHSLSGDVFNCFGDVLGFRDYFFVDLAEGQESISDESVAVAVAVPAVR